jgi:hypothetical protein
MVEHVLPESKRGMEGRGGCWGQVAEMTHTMYAHVNKWIILKNKLSIGTKNRHIYQWSRVEEAEIRPFIHRIVRVDKGAKTMHEEEDNLFIKWG